MPMGDWKCLKLTEPSARHSMFDDDDDDDDDDYYYYYYLFYYYYCFVFFCFGTKLV